MARNLWVRRQASWTDNAFMATGGLVVEDDRPPPDPDRWRRRIYTISFCAMTACATLIVLSLIQPVPTAPFAVPMTLTFGGFPIYAYTVIVQARWYWCGEGQPLFG